MAFNWKTFQTRTLTAIVFAAVMLTGLLWNYWSFFVLFSIIHFGCWWEYLKLAEKIYKVEIDKTIKYFFCICGYLVFLIVAYSNYSYDFLWVPFGKEISLKWGLIILVIVCLYTFIFQNQKLTVKQKWFVVAGFIYISVSWGLMINFYEPHTINIYDGISVTNSIYIPLVIVASIWINDTMAYIVGSIVGKTPLAKVSPKKTWEGTIGGIVLSTVLIYFLWNSLVYPGSGSSNLNILAGIIALISSIVGTIGDLLESKLKRRAGVKDSGSMMPGHGGFLDRFDSMLLATPAVWLYVAIFL